MRNIIKALNYQTRKDIYTIVGMMIGILILFFSLFVDGPGIDHASGGEVAIRIYNILAGEGAIVFPLLVVLFVTRICGWDANDKTINYEILSGHVRKEVIFARVITSIGWCMATLLILFILPVTIITLIKGWGDNIAFSDFLIRFVVSLFPTLRLILFYVLLTFLLGNSFKALIIGFVGFEGMILVPILLEEFLSVKLPCLLAVSNMGYVAGITNAAQQVVNGTEIYVYKAGLAGGDIVKTILISLLMSAVYLLLTMKYYEKKDVR